MSTKAASLPVTGVFRAAMALRERVPVTLAVIWTAGLSTSLAMVPSDWRWPLWATTTRSSLLPAVPATYCRRANSSALKLRWVVTSLPSSVNWPLLPSLRKATL